MITTPGPTRQAVPPTTYEVVRRHAVSMLDRLLHHATTVITNGQSYRMLQARQRRGGPPLTP